MKNKLIKLITIIGCLTAFSFTLNAQDGAEKPLEDSLIRLEAYIFMFDKVSKDSTKTKEQAKSKILLQAAENAKRFVIEELQISGISKDRLKELAKYINNPDQADLIYGQMADSEIIDKVKWDQEGGEAPVLDDIKRLKDKIKAGIKKEEVASPAKTGLTK